MSATSGAGSGTNSDAGTEDIMRITRHQALEPSTLPPRMHIGRKLES